MCERVFEREWGGPLYEERELDPPAKGRLSEVSAPTLVIAGEFDVPAIRDVSTLLADGISGARRIDLPAGHVPPVEMPERVTSVLEEFLGTLRLPVDA
jgi:pimeloyl-ACP methyl ester carboxylesterase